MFYLYNLFFIYNFIFKKYELISYYFNDKIINFIKKIQCYKFSITFRIISHLQSHSSRPPTSSSTQQTPPVTLSYRYFCKWLINPAIGSSLMLKCQTQEIDKPIPLPLHPLRL